MPLMTDDLSAILERIASGEYSEADITALQQALQGAEGRSLFQLGKYNITIGDGKDIHIGDRTFVEINDAAVQAIVETIQNSVAPKTAAQIDFQPYLQSIIEDEDYREWNEVYTPTTLEGRKPLSQSKFSRHLKLRVETVKSQVDQERGEASETANREQVEQWDALAGLRNYAAEHVLLVGKPGSGKSTSLERLLWEEADNASQNPAAKIPVLVKLRRCTSTLEHLIQYFFSRHQLPLEITDIKYLLRQGKLLLLLDGLNELPDAFGAEVVNFRDRHRKTTSMIVSTRDVSMGGTLGIDKALKMLPLTESQMQAFVQRYLDEKGEKLFQQLKGDRLRKFAETPLLLWMLCRVFAQNGQVPANLGLAFREFTQLYDQQIQADVPTQSREQWSKLLRHIAFFLMHDEKPFEFRLSMPWEEAENLLTECLQQEGRANARECAERWLRDLLDYHLLQPVRQSNFAEHIEFRHQLIQEYYAAEYLLRLLPKLSDEQLKQNYLNLLKWTESIALTLALVDEEDQALRVVKLAMDNVDLMLGARLAGEVQDFYQVKAVGLIDVLEVPLLLKCRLWENSSSRAAIPGLLKNIADQNSYVRESVAKALIKIDGNAAIPGLVEAVEHRNLDVRRIAAKTLARIGNEASIPGLLKALNGRDFSAYHDAAKALGKIGSSVAIPGLLKTVEDQSPACCWAVDALGEIGDAAVAGLIKIINYPSPCPGDPGDSACRAVEALGKINSEKAIPALIKALEHQTPLVQTLAAEVLGNIGSKEAIPILLKLFKQLDSQFQNSAGELIRNFFNEELIIYLNQAVEDHNEGDSEAYSLAYNRLYDQCKSKDIIISLFEALQDLRNIRESAAKALGQIGNKTAIPGLVEAIEHRYSDVRFNAVKALGEIGNDAATPNLLKALEDQNRDVRRATVKALGQIGSEVAIPGLLRKALEDESLSVKEQAVKSLGQIGSAAAISSLIEVVASPKYISGKAESVIAEIGEPAISDLTELLKHEDSDIRRKAAFTLGEIGKKDAIFALAEALEDQDYDVIKAALRALGKIGDISSIPSLFKALKHQSSDVRHTAICALDRINDKTILIPGFLKALENPCSLVRQSAARSLGEIGDETVIPNLLQATEDKEWPVRVRAVEALGKKVSGKADSKAITPFLLRALGDQNFEVRYNAVQVLRKVGGKDTIPILFKLLEDQKTSIRRAAIEASFEIDNDTAVPGLLKALEDEEPSIRRHAAKLLGASGHKDATPGLIKALKDKGSYEVGAVSYEHETVHVRETVIEALGQIGDEAAISGLLKIIEDKDYSFRGLVAKVLGEIGSEDAVQSLLKLLEDQNYSVRRLTVEALGQIGSRAAIPGLLKMIEFERPDVRYPSDIPWLAIEALFQIDHKTAVPVLFKAIEHQYPGDPGKAAHMLSEIDDPMQIAALWHLHLQKPKDYLEKAISTLQEYCKFYNYEVAQGAISLAAPQENTVSSKHSQCSD